MNGTPVTTDYEKSHYAHFLQKHAYFKGEKLIHICYTSKVTRLSTQSVREITARVHFEGPGVGLLGVPLMSMAIVPPAVAFDLGLSLCDVRVLLYFAAQEEQHQSTGWYSWEPLAIISKALKLSIHAVHCSRVKLLRCGYLQCTTATVQHVCYNDSGERVVTYEEQRLCYRVFIKSERNTQ